MCWGLLGGAVEKVWRMIKGSLKALDNFGISVGVGREFYFLIWTIRFTT